MEAICQAPSPFLATPKGLSISGFPSESLRNSQRKMQLAGNRGACLKIQLLRRKYLTHVAMWRPLFIPHLLKWGGSIEEDREASSGELSGWQINRQHLQKQRRTHLSGHRRHSNKQNGKSKIITITTPANIRRQKKICSIVRNHWHWDVKPHLVS